MWHILGELKKLVVLFSGEGKNLESLIQKLHNRDIRDSDSCSRFEIVAAITNKAEAKGIEVATQAHISTVVLDHTLFNSREAFDSKLVKLIDSFEADLVIMAGFMRILTPVFTQNVRAINLHPSLLPLHKGARAIERSFESKEDFGGVSVHYVSDELDGGSVILQKKFPKEEDESFEDFHAKIKALEFELLPKAIRRVLCEN